MHTGPMSEDQGNFNDSWKPCDSTCRKCGKAGMVFYDIWESSDGAYEDFKYECLQPGCGATWWVEGPDA